MHKLSKRMKHLIDTEVPMPYRCEHCKHHKGGYKCAAFDDIPLDFYFNAEQHTTVVDGQKGNYVFETVHEREVMRVYGEDVPEPEA